MAVLWLGVFGFFTAIIGMDGVSEQKAMPILIGYGVLAVMTLTLSPLLSWAMAGALATRAKLSMWAAGPLSFFLITVVAGAVLFFGFLLLTIVLGVK